MEGLIYKITNIKNGHAYVGKTIQKLITRWQQHIRYPACSYLYRAIQKYGIENFRLEILERTNDINTLPNLEYKHILTENTIVPNGYNLVLDTHHGRGFHTQMLQKMSINKQGSSPHNKRSSKFKGIRRYKTYCEVRLIKDSKVNRAIFKNENEAASAYDKAAVFLYGPNAKLNFPDKLNIYIQENLFDFFNLHFNVNNKTSKFPGVSKHAQTDKWQAYCYVDGVQKYIGIFPTENRARAARQQFLSKQS